MASKRSSQLACSSVHASVKDYLLQFCYRLLEFSQYGKFDDQVEKDVVIRTLKKKIQPSKMFTYLLITQIRYIFRPLI